MKEQRNKQNHRSLVMRTLGGGGGGVACAACYLEAKHSRHAGNLFGANIG